VNDTCARGRLVPLTAQLLILASANDLIGMHKQILVDISLGAALRIERWKCCDTGASAATAALDAQSAEKLQGAIDAIGAATGKLDSDAVQRPFTVLGVPASLTLVSSVLSLLVVGWSFVGSLLVNVLRVHYVGFYDVAFGNHPNRTHAVLPANSSYC
jgi:hypothetical protein